MLFLCAGISSLTSLIPFGCLTASRWARQWYLCPAGRPALQAHLQCRFPDPLAAATTAGELQQLAGCVPAKIVALVSTARHL